VVKRIMVATSCEDGRTVELTISDTGCGVSSDDKAKLFIPYYSTKGRGSGLGLAIVNHILEEHKASIRVEDNQPIGTRFVIELATAEAGNSGDADSATSHQTNGASIEVKQP
jgi:signal transduction histidine kinase